MASALLCLGAHPGQGKSSRACSGSVICFCVKKAQAQKEGQAIEPQATRAPNRWIWSPLAGEMGKLGNPTTQQTHFVLITVSGIAHSIPAIPPFNLPPAPTYLIPHSPIHTHTHTNNLLLPVVCCCCVICVWSPRVVLFPTRLFQIWTRPAATHSLSGPGCRFSFLDLRWGLLGRFPPDRSVLAIVCSWPNPEIYLTVFDHPAPPDR